jgi:hypothetical protein
MLDVVFNLRQARRVGQELCKAANTSQRRR